VPLAISTASSTTVRVTIRQDSDHIVEVKRRRGDRGREKPLFDKAGLKTAPNAKRPLPSGIAAAGRYAAAVESLLVFISFAKTDARILSEAKPRNTEEERGKHEKQGSAKGVRQHGAMRRLIEFKSGFGGIGMNVPCPVPPCPVPRSKDRVRAEASCWVSLPSFSIKSQPTSMATPANTIAKSRSFTFAPHASTVASIGQILPRREYERQSPVLQASSLVQVRSLPPAPV
jgi:hypothetical protein